MTLRVLAESPFGVSQVPSFHTFWSAEMSAGMPLALLQPATQALQPTQSVES